MKILIVGASFAGVGCARTLIEQKSGHEVTIVDPRNYVEVNYMNPRLLQEPEKHSNTVAKLETLSWVPQATIVQATVTRLESKEAGLSNGGTVSFDICVICCGAERAASHWSRTSWLTSLLDHLSSLLITSASSDLHQFEFMCI